ncbi:phosphoglycolate phosphatase [Infirmifilum uzonense]|jgi:phosphoglycolate phosphatase (TIGR01487 family)|uniref:phosphoglycolate phosphatase n=1 Tax=Infirmifilum TaxID=2856573 RepID=UPI003C727A5E
MSSWIFIDVDWTLTDHERKISSRVVGVLEKLVAKGYVVALASATAYPIVYGLARYLPTSEMIVAENGGVVGYRTELEVLGRVDKDRIIRVAEEKLSCCLRDSWQNLFRFVDVTFVVREDIEPEVAIREAKRVFEPMNLEVMYSGVALHVHPPGINKGQGIRKLFELLSESPKKIIAIGDSEVDIEMFKLADFSACPSHSPDYVKESVDYVASRPYSDGFIEIVEKFLL